MSGKELCNECGKNTAWGSGLFVDRVPCLDGGWICRECDEAIRMEAEIRDLEVEEKR